MSNYTFPQTAFTFTDRDGLAPGNAEKEVKGEQLDPEFEAIAVAIATKIDSDGTIDGGTF